MQVRPGHREKSVDLQGTLKLLTQVRFYNRISRSQRPHSENWHAHYSLRARSMATNASMSSMKIYERLGTCVHLASGSSAPHSHAGFACAV